MEQQYIQILEKTNQQLGLWTNPYGIMIGVLAILFTILTIIAAVVIYQQSKDYKEKIDKLLGEYEKQLKASSKSQKAEIEKAIENLKGEKLFLGNTIGPLTVS